MIRVILLCLSCTVLPGCIIGTAVGVATDVVTGTVSVATDVVGTAVDVVKPGKKKSKFSE